MPSPNRLVWLLPVAFAVACSSRIASSYPKPPNPTGLDIHAPLGRVSECLRGASWIELLPTELLTLDSLERGPSNFRGLRSSGALNEFIAHSWEMGVGPSPSYSSAGRALEYSAAFKISLLSRGAVTHISVVPLEYRVIVGKRFVPWSHSGYEYDWIDVPPTSIDEYCIMLAAAKCVGVSAPALRVPRGQDTRSTLGWSAPDACTLQRTEPSRQGDPSQEEPE